MNTLTLTQPALRMTSREIANLTGKRHDNVIRDIRKMLADLRASDSFLKFEEAYIDTQNGQSFPMFSLPKDLTLTLVSGYNVKLRKRIIDRWMELEQQTASSHFNVPQTMPEALRLAAVLADRALALEHKVAEQTPKVLGFDRIAGTSGTLTLREAAKALQVPERKCIDWLLSNKWLFRRPSNNGLMAYADRIKQGYLVHKTAAYLDPQSGIDVLRETVRVTAKGLTHLADSGAVAFMRL